MLKLLNKWKKEMRKAWVEETILTRQTRKGAIDMGMVGIQSMSSTQLNQTTPKSLLI